MAREIDLMRREQAFMQREIQLLERENQFLRVTGGTTRDNTISEAEVLPKYSVKAISELLSDFNGAEGTFRNWEKQARLLIVTYRLNDSSTKILIGTRLKGKALEWFHLRPEPIELNVDEILTEMR